MFESWFFNGWTPLLQMVLLGTLSYASLILFLRVSGKRTLAKMNAFDLVVTVALGSTLATILLSREVVLAQGVLALALLVLFQLVVAWLSVRSRRFSRLIKAEPTLLLHRGQILEGPMRRERVAADELRAAVRAAQLGDLHEADAVVLETDGTFTVVPRASRGDGSALEGTRDDGGAPDHAA